MRGIAGEAQAKRPTRRAALWLVFLGPFFFATYGLANWVASLRADVGSVVFDWEQRIPFLAWTIVPYWSIDFLYAISVFVCATRTELDVHARRLACAQVICVVCFLLFPLAFTFPRPAVAGVYGWMFGVLMGFDKPFNQAPSLHIALLVCLWVLFLRHLRGLSRWLLHAWFALIVVSVLTTYQHHFIDIPTGLWVGWLCVWLFPVSGASLLASAFFTEESRRRALALRYAGAGLGVAVLAAMIGGWALWLLWPAGSLGLVAVIYAFLRATAFQKQTDGSMSTAARWLFAPYFVGAWINSRWWTRSSATADEVVPGLLLGRVPTPGECRALGVRAVVDVTAEMPCALAGVHYVNVPLLDLVAPSVRQITDAVRAIEAAFTEGPVLVCCALGFSRSAVIVASWLVATGRAGNHAEAIEYIRRARPRAVFEAEHIMALEQFVRQRNLLHAGV